VGPLVVERGHAADSCINFNVQVAATAAGLANAPIDALQFSTPPGPLALAGLSAVARLGPPNTTAGALVVDTSLMAKGAPGTSRSCG